MKNNATPQKSREAHAPENISMRSDEVGAPANNSPNARAFGDPRLPARFWNKVAVDTRTGCWLWTASLSSSGYAQTWDGKKVTRGHRYAFLTLVGAPPVGRCLDHLCRVIRCVNPAHLEVVTVRENCLRGVSSAAQHARKTHCHRGHPFDEANTIRRRQQGGAFTRECRACKAFYDANRTAESRERKRAMDAARERRYYAKVRRDRRVARLADQARMRGG